MCGYLGMVLGRSWKVHDHGSNLGYALVSPGWEDRDPGT